MKKVIALLVVLLILFGSCQRAMFATSKRITNKGKVTYTKLYHHYNRKLSKGMPRRISTPGPEIQSTFDQGRPIILTPEIKRMTPVAKIQSENLLASGTTEEVFSVIVVKNGWLNAGKGMIRKENSDTDTTITETRVQAGQVESFYADTRKNEKFGLAGFILSIPGLVPIICLPLAILALIFGIISLRKIKRNPTFYKGKGFAIASIILGVLGILGVLIFIG